MELTAMKRIIAALTLAALCAAPSVVRAQCTAPNPPVSVVPMSAVVAQGGYLSSDGKGAYVDGTQGSIVDLNGGGNGGANLRTSVDVPLNPKSRFLSFNLNSPFNDPNPVVPDAVFALPLGVVQDLQGELHVLYRVDPPGPTGQHQEHSIQEVPDDGVFYTSERTNLFVTIGGVRHLLMFGGEAWPFNLCRPDEGAIFSAAGTTKLQIARLPDSDTFLLQAPAGSIARLFDYSNTFAPIDKGLYRFSFLVTFSPKPVKGKK